MDILLFYLVKSLRDSIVQASTSSGALEYKFRTTSEMCDSKDEKSFEESSRGQVFFHGFEDFDVAELVENKLSDIDEEEDIILRQLPRTPLASAARGKRRRRASDVIDSMGERGCQLYNFNSPATCSTSASPYSYYCGSSTPASSSGFTTPRRGTNRNAISPDQGYATTPEFVQRAVIPEWMLRRIDSHDATVPIRNDEDNYSTSPAEARARMSAQKDADRYNMEHRNRGKCVIFNHETFDTGFETREGSSVDARRIEQTFQQLGFTVEICDDYEHSGVMNKLNELSEEDHSDNDCLCIFVLTHGLKNDLICAKDVVYKLENVWKPFTADKCSSLAGKPKLFFFQACRGDNLDGGIKMMRSGTTETDSSSASYQIPTYADFLFAHSTVQGFYSWRNPEEGTWYVQSLCDVFDEYAATHDLAKLMTITARKVATNFASYNDLDPMLHGKKQVPSVISSLIRDVYFTPKN
ncbi:caspase-1-like isoform X1 [Nasonia vitripennis]|uniref:Caspase-1 n=1 Tax=Nasonia vitripennis TaxID=7425 RepID=A0A7M7M200_NASVI|nr:caspase-1-like isoform X1 [Nasonia vitripennis]